MTSLADIADQIDALKHEHVDPDDQQATSQGLATTILARYGLDAEDTVITATQRVDAARGNAAALIEYEQANSDILDWLPAAGWIDGLIIGLELARVRHEEAAGA